MWEVIWLDNMMVHQYIQMVAYLNWPWLGWSCWLATQYFWICNETMLAGAICLTIIQTTWYNSTYDQQKSLNHLTIEALEENNTLKDLSKVYSCITISADFSLQTLVWCLPCYRCDLQRQSLLFHESRYHIYLCQVRITTLILSNKGNNKGIIVGWVKSD